MSPVQDQSGAFLRGGKAAAYTRGDSLSGVPVAIKDLLLTDDQGATTAASKFLEPFMAPYEATAVQKLRAAGARIVGKTNLDEFAMGTSTETSALGTTTNPWDASRVPGGSSGGSAAAVAAGLVPVALGTDTGGSCRQPAAFCGVVGLKPTYGRVSRYGVIAVASSLDQVGVLASDVTWTAQTLQVISGVDVNDATSVDRPVPDYAKALTGDIKGLRVGLPKEYFIEGIEPAVAEAIEQAAETYRKLGATIVDISLPHTKYAIATYYIIQPSEMSANLARYDGIRYGRRAPGAQTLHDTYLQSRSEGFGPEVQRRIMLGTYALSAGYYDAYYRKAMQVRTLIKQDFDQAFQDVDVMLTPTTPTTAFQLGAKTNDPLEMYLNDIFTVSANLAGVPGISVPAGFDGQGLPIGLQLLSPHWGEETLLNAAFAYEQQHDWHAKRPPLTKEM